ncbi:MAG TPA: NADH-quinone oxidoreductase subunit M [Acidimicrobiales bacterium]|nr:NADH-quinone oxidoreductase subunit M [Acidimicrobiales bacterium]
MSGAISRQQAFPFLTAIILVPVFAASLILAIPRDARRLIRGVALVASVAVLGISAAVIDLFRTGDGGYQMVSNHMWAPGLGISWSIGVDGISLFLVALTSLLFPLVLFGAYARQNTKSFSVWILLLEAGCLGSFLSLDLLMFFLFFEATLVPIYFLMVSWGHEGRNRAAMKFLVYTFVGSAFLLVGAIALAFMHQSQTGLLTFDIRSLVHTHVSGTEGVLLMLAFTFAFAVKAPIWPFHTWSPDTYAEAPASASIILGGVMAKLGTYGIVRFDLELFPHATILLAPLFLTLGVIGIIYGGIVAAQQRDLKRLVAFSSLSHMGFIVLGAFALTGESVSGAVVEMLNHGLYTAALFLLIAMIYSRRRTFEIARLRGLQGAAPVMAGIFTLVMLASIGVPGLNGFVGEFLILAGTFAAHRWWAVVAVLGVVISAVYMLWAYQQIFHASQPMTDPKEPLRDLTTRERLVLVPLVVLIVALGVYPKPVLDRIEPAVNQLIMHVHQVEATNALNANALSPLEGR